VRKIDDARVPTKQGAQEYQPDQWLTKQRLQFFATIWTPIAIWQSVQVERSK
jgi:hypothetical protein